MVKRGCKNIIQIKSLDTKSAYKYDGCEYCAFHNTEPGICEECDNESEFEPSDSEDMLEVA